MVLKRLFLGLWSSWWPSWAHLVASWANLLPKWGHEMGSKSGSQGVQKMTLIGSQQVITTFFLFNFWFLFGLVLEFILEPILNPKICPKFVNFWFLFLGGFGALWVPLGRPSWVSWGSLGRPQDSKTWKTHDFLRFLKRQFVGSLKLLMAIWSQNGFPKWGPKVETKWKKWTKT